MRLMSYTAAMEQGFVPRLQGMMPQAPQGPTLAGGMLGVGVGPEGNGSLVPAPQAGQPGTAQSGTQPGSALRRNVTPDLRGQLRQGVGLEMPPAMTAAGGGHA